MIYPASVLVLALGALGISESLLAQDRLPDAEPPLVVSWAPERPGEGELFVVRVTELEGDSIVRITARAGDEPLHFARDEQGTFETLAAVPLGVQSQIAMGLTVMYANGREEETEYTIPVTPGIYNHRELDVAPRFGSPPDSAQRARRSREARRAAEVSTRSHRTPRMWGNEVVLPREDRTTSIFGQGRVFNGQVSSRHTGMDLDGETGDTIYAAATGMVDLAGQFELAGNNVYLNHGGGLVTAYFHMDRQLVAEGDTVQAGQPIGLIGETGRVTGPHLHWVVRYGWTSVDPRSLMSLAGNDTNVR